MEKCKAQKERKRDGKARGKKKAGANPEDEYGAEEGPQAVSGFKESKFTNFNKYMAAQAQGKQQS